MTTVRYLDRKLLRNIIRHTETHNRLQEENEMWRSKAQGEFGWKKGRRRRSREHSRSIRHGREMDRFRDEDLEDVHEQRSWNAGLNREIYRAELADQERWGHNGFMELYPEEFINRESMDEMSDQDQEIRKTSKKAKRNRKHNRENESSKKRKEWEACSASSKSHSTSSEEETKTSKHRPKKHRSMPEPSRHHIKAASKSRTHSYPERMPSIDTKKKRTHRHVRTKDGSSNHKRAPSSGHENSSQRDAKNGSKKGEKRASEHQKKTDKGNGHRDWPAEEIYFSDEKQNDRDLNIKKKRDDDSPIGYSERLQSRRREKRKKTKKSTKRDGETSPSKHRDGGHGHHKSSRKERKKSRENGRTDKWERWK